MDARTFGGFVAACRREKGMTQAELAEKLHVTDKAVSRWERGVGFPNIATLEPLAAALEVSVLELMKSERIEAAHLGQEEAAGVVLDTLDVAKDQRQRERRNVLALLGGVAVADLVILLLDNLKWQGGALFIWGAGVAFPLFCLSGALALLNAIGDPDGLSRKSKSLYRYYEDELMKQFPDRPELTGFYTALYGRYGRYHIDLVCFRDPNEKDDSWYPEPDFEAFVQTFFDP